MWLVGVFFLPGSRDGCLVRGKACKLRQHVEEARAIHQSAAVRHVRICNCRAKIVYPNGDTFEGVFNADKAKHGHGKYVWTKEVGEDGPKNAWVPVNEEGDAAALPEGLEIAYEGGYKDGLSHGIGKMTYPNGDIYHGAWAVGLPNGDGTYYYASGDLYSGQWKAGKKEGRGAYVYRADDSQLVSTACFAASCSQTYS